MIVSGEEFFDFRLADMDGAFRDTASERSSGLLVVSFFKVNCPVCQMTAPYLQMLAEAYPHGLTVWGVSQNDAAVTRDYSESYKCDIPMLLDHDLAVTDRFDLATVPATYLTDALGRVLMCSAVWDREWMNRLSQTIADRIDAPFVAVVSDDDPVLSYRPG